MRVGYFILCALSAMALVNGPSRVLAQRALERQCLTQGAPGLIEACTKLIEGGRGNLAAYHVAGGGALLDKKDCDGALADFDAAVRSQPTIRIITAAAGWSSIPASLISGRPRRPSAR
jgi:hypothetical protein